MNTNVLRLRPIDLCCEPVVEPAPMASEDRDRMIAIFRALGDKTRLEIFRLIAAQHEPICACEIVDRFDVSQPTIAHHTKTLREAGLITTSKSGIWAYYQVDRQTLEMLGSMVDVFLPEPLSIR